MTMLKTAHPHFIHRRWLNVCACLGFFIVLLVILLFSMQKPAWSQVAPDAFSCADVSQISQDECQALVALYNSTGGTTSIAMTTWLQPDSLPCSWSGITCADGHVTEIQLLRAGLNGVIPPELGNLTSLQTLNLSENYLAGSIPLELGRLLQLIHLNLSHNQLSGAIPSSLGKLSHLKYFNLQFNQLSSSIPATLTVEMTDLQEIWLDRNLLTGTVPMAFSLLANLETLHLYRNALQGDVPPGFNKVGSSLIPPKKLDLDLSYNRLSCADKDVCDFLNTHERDWADSQTVPPTNNQVTNTGATTATFTWNLIPFRLEAGNYQVSVSTSPVNMNPMATTASKLDASVTVTNLCPNTTYYFALRTHTPADAARDQKNDLLSAWSQRKPFTTAPRGDLKLLSIYMLAFDNDLDRAYEPLLQALEAATAQDTSKVAVILADRNGAADTQILVVQCGKRESFTAGLPSPTDFRVLDANLHEYNMTDPAQLAAFLKWARFTYPAPQSLVTYISHGVPLAPAVDISKYLSSTTGSQPDPHNIFAVPSGQYIHDSPGQVTDEHPTPSLISPYALTIALRDATDNGAHPFTVLDIVHCFGGTLEELYELSNPEGKPIAETIVSSPSYAYSGPELLRRALLAVQPGQTARQMAAAMVDAYHQALIDASTSAVEHPHLMTAVVPTQTILLKSDVDNLAQALMNSFAMSPTITMNKVINVDQTVAKFNTTTCDGGEKLPLKADFSLDAKDGLSDLADLATKLGVEFSQTREVQLAAANVADQIKQTIIASARAPGKPYFDYRSDPKPNWPFDDTARYQGIAIYADFQGVTDTIGNTYIGWQAHWYTSTNDSGDNPYPYAFVRIGGVTWADVLHRFWENRTQHVKTVICTTMLPDALSYKRFLPVVVK